MNLRGTHVNIHAQATNRERNKQVLLAIDVLMTTISRIKHRSTEATLDQETINYQKRRHLGLQVLDRLRPFKPETLIDTVGRHLLARDLGAILQGMPKIPEFGTHCTFIVLPGSLLGRQLPNSSPTWADLVLSNTHI